MCLLAACSRHPAPPPDAATLRLVSTAPNLTECVFAIGAGDTLVGRTDVCDHPPAALAIPATGGFGTPWLESLLTLRPTHVLETVLADPAIRERLAALGIPVVHIPCARLAEIPGALRQLGALTGHTAQADALADAIQRGITAPPPAPDRPRVLLLFAPDAPITAGRDAFIAELLELAGGINIGRGSTSDYYNISLEWIITQDPDILLCIFETAGRAPASLFTGQTGWKSLRAVREGRVYTVPDLGSVSRPGPRVLEGLAQLKAVLTHDANR